MDRSMQLDIWRKPNSTLRVAPNIFLIKSSVLRSSTFARHDPTLARSLLETFRTIQAQHIAHRDHILILDSWGCKSDQLAAPPCRSVTLYPQAFACGWSRGASPPFG
jgi:hypothetical protein